MKILKAFIERALDNHGDGISIEYKDGYEEIFLLKGNLGIGLDKIRSNSSESESMFDELAKIKKQGYIITDNQQILLGVETYDNFGEEAYKITILNSAPNLVQ